MGAAPDSCDGLRGIAVGTLPAKLFACIMERRISDLAEASVSRAACQFGFRRQRSTGQAAQVLRTLQDRHRSWGSSRLQSGWTCMKPLPAPRQLLWPNLAARSLVGAG